MNTILVLMSTFNGEKYIAEQIESILAQKGVNVELLVRDDGSTDKTIEILNSYQKRGLLSYYVGTNMGTARSFMDLLIKAPDEFDFYAFSDQDDVWLPNKLSKAIKQLVNEVSNNCECAYFSNLRPVDLNLNIIKESLIHKDVSTNYKEIIINSSCFFGCTCVFTHALKQRLNVYGIPSKLIYHDLWVAVIASCVGKVIFDTNAYILYRQHGDNQVGAKLSFREKMTSRWRRLFCQRVSIAEQAQEIISCVGEDFLRKKGYWEYTRMVANYQQNIRCKWKYLLEMETDLSVKAHLFHIILVLLNRV